MSTLSIPALCSLCFLHFSSHLIPDSLLLSFLSSSFLVMLSFFLIRIGYIYLNCTCYIIINTFKNAWNVPTVFIRKILVVWRSTGTFFACSSFRIPCSFFLGPIGSPRSFRSLSVHIVWNGVWNIDSHIKCYRYSFVDWGIQLYWFYNNFYCKVQWTDQCIQINLLLLKRRHFVL